MSLADKHRLLCGCNVYTWKDGSGAEIEYCPMHKAAPDMVDALQAASIRLSVIKDIHGFLFFWDADDEYALRKIEEAIALVKGK